MASRVLFYTASGLGAVLIAAAQTKPEDAASNIAGWLKILGIDRVPDFLASQQADLWFTFIGLACVVGAGIFGIRRRIWSVPELAPAIEAQAQTTLPSTVEISFNIRKDSNVPENDEEIIRRVMEQLGQSGLHVTSHNQSGGITAGAVHIHGVDKSLKRQLRDLLAAADSRIPFEIDNGKLDIETRMTAAQFARLNKIANSNGSVNLIAKAEVTGHFFKSQRNDGFGPTSAVEEQVRVQFQFTPELKE
jgi:hypothetical protein